jgi:hypothetical protein
MPQLTKSATARNIKLNTILKEDSEEEKNNNNTKLKDNIFNTPTALGKYINLTTTVEKSKDKLHF